MCSKKKPTKRQNERPTRGSEPPKKRIEHIPDTPENVAKALFGIRPDGKKVKTMKA